MNPRVPNRENSIAPSSTNFLDVGYRSTLNERTQLLDPHSEVLQEHFRNIWDLPGARLSNWVMTRTGFREYMLKRYWSNVTERTIFVMQFPKQVRFEKVILSDKNIFQFVDCCNNLLKLNHYEKQKLSFGYYDHDFDDRISVTDGLLMMRYISWY